MALSPGKRLSFTLIIGLASVLVVEGVARLIPRTKQVVPPLSQFDKRLGWSLKPSSQAVGWIGENTIHYRINSKGVRGDETPYEKPEGTFRIVVMGDSNTFGYGVPIEKHFTSILEGYFRDVEVINMGVNGYGVDQELLSLQLEGFRYEPNLVVAYVPHYGAHRHMHTRRFGKPKPRFVLRDEKLVLTNFPVESPLVDKNVLQKIHWWFIRHSRAYKTFRDGLLYFKNRAALRQRRQKRKQQSEKNTKDKAFTKKLFSLGDALIHEMHLESEKRGAAFVLVTKMPELHEAASKKQLFSLDVSLPLYNSRFALPEPFRHMNESANGVLAYEIARFLQQKSLIPQKHIRTK